MVPFDDELSAVGVLVVPYQTGWPGRVRALGRIARVRARTGRPAHRPRRVGVGYRQRPEPWNHVERAFGVASSKLVYAPPVGARAVNIHVRGLGGAGARYTLLFRDYLRAEPAARDTWSAFKLRLAQSVPDIYDYGQIKTPATEMLMPAAVRWADATGWAP